VAGWHPPTDPVTQSAAASPNPYRRSLLKRQRSRDTRRALLRSAAKLWAENGFDATTVEQICADAGVGRTTFYLHFESKERLLGELAWGTASGVAAEVEEARSGGMDQQLDAFIDGVARRMEAVPKALTALVIRSATFETPALPAPDADHISFSAVITGVLEDAQQVGEISTTADIAELGAILGGMTMEAIERWASGESGEQTLSDALRLRLSLIVDPIRT
jgi:AcrR family transcriptional regulator